VNSWESFIPLMLRRRLARPVDTSDVHCRSTSLSQLIPLLRPAPNRNGFTLEEGCRLISTSSDNDSINPSNLPRFAEKN